MAAWLAPLIARLASGMAATQSTGGTQAAGRLAAAAKDGIKVAERIYRPQVLGSSKAVRAISETQLDQPGTAERRRSDLKAAAELTMLGFAAYGAKRGLEALARHQMESAEGLMKFSGSIAKSVLQLQRQEYLLKFRTAAATSGSTQTLSEAVQNMNESLQPTKELTTNIKNIAGAASSVIVSAIAEWANVLLRPLNELVSKLTGRSSNSLPVVDFLEKIKSGDFTSVDAGPDEMYEQARASNAKHAPRLGAKVIGGVLNPYLWYQAITEARELDAKTKRPSGG